MNTTISLVPSFSAPTPFLPYFSSSDF
uniref:Uncharacterized protein n=1 Tax=Arundo donax TaxID=35708 RepID=A0A0A8ZFH3_ARUDO